VSRSKIREISGHIADFGLIFKDVIYKINIITLHDVIDGLEEGVIGYFF